MTLRQVLAVMSGEVQIIDGMLSRSVVYEGYQFFATKELSKEILDRHVVGIMDDCDKVGRIIIFIASK